MPRGQGQRITFSGCFRYAAGRTAAHSTCGVSLSATLCILALKIPSAAPPADCDLHRGRDELYGNA
ncbi:hypothetical protein JM93_00832 [Roseibium hamelinense]|uniref:Uncharacterized protein n=1 Tax=Roseibium hamelinense TaxID=150831 RepID=A0A562THY8_9HYPH|nr:hypothetical protein JM93_00832 [Roseibium hamelinense]